jgi:rhamnosyl/mannosyltransferase
MNVLQLSRFYYPHVGGVEEVVRQIAEGVTGADIDVLAATSRGVGTRSKINGVDVRKTGSFGQLLSVPIAPGYPFQVVRSKSSYNVYHVHLPNPLAVVSTQLSGLSSAPMVVTYHSDIVRQADWLPVYRPILQRFLSTVKRIIVTSPRLLENSSVLEPFSEKCRVIPLGVDLDTFDPDNVKPAVPDCIDPTCPIVLFVGRLNYYKGVEHLVDAAAGIDAELLVVGNGPRRESLERRAVSADVSDQVHFLGKVSDETLHRCYSAADLFVLPSVEPSEAFGIVQLEAMAYETPVVNTDLPSGVPWVSKDGETGLTVPPADPDALAEAVSTLLSDQKLRQRFARAARERVEDRFSQAQMLSSVHEVYCEVAE